MSALSHPLSSQTLHYLGWPGQSHHVFWFEGHGFLRRSSSPARRCRHRSDRAREGRLWRTRRSLRTDNRAGCSKPWHADSGLRKVLVPDQLRTPRTHPSSVVAHRLRQKAASQTYVPVLPACGSVRATYGDESACQIRPNPRPSSNLTHDRHTPQLMGTSTRSSVTPRLHHSVHPACAVPNRLVRRSGRSLVRFCRARGGDVEGCVEQGCIRDHELFEGVGLEYGCGGSEADDGVCIGSQPYLLAFLEV